MLSSPHPLIDIGVNMSSSRLLKRREEILSRALSAHVKGLIFTGTDLESSELLCELCDSEHKGTPRLWSTAGVHPHDAERVLTESPSELAWVDRLRRVHDHPSVVAVGECGLDFERNYSPPKVQRAVFEAQLRLAVEMQKPLFLHQRGAQHDFLAMLTEYLTDLPIIGPEGERAAVVHCYTDGPELLETLVDLGCSIGITGWICDERRADLLRDAVTHLPLSRVLVETDAPYLIPRTLRPKPKKGFNEPAYLPHILEQISLYMKASVDQISLASLVNTQRLFSISLE
jgi:TatD DNase family protein